MSYNGENYKDHEGTLQLVVQAQDALQVRARGS